MRTSSRPRRDSHTLPTMPDLPSDPPLRCAPTGPSIDSLAACFEALLSGDKRGRVLGVCRAVGVEDGVEDELGRFGAEDLRRVVAVALVVARLRDAGCFVGHAYGSLPATRVGWALGLGWVAPHRAGLHADRFFVQPVTADVAFPVAPGITDADLDHAARAFSARGSARVRGAGSVRFLTDARYGGVSIHLEEAEGLEDVGRAFRAGQLHPEAVDLDDAVRDLVPERVYFDVDVPDWAWLRRVQPSSLEELAAARALDRPGPRDAGIAARYLEHSSREPAAVTAVTRGVLVYQEQVAEQIHQQTGMSLEDAHGLRRSLGRAVRSADDAELPALFARFAQYARARGNEPSWEAFEHLALHAAHAFDRTTALSNAILTALSARPLA